MGSGVALAVKKKYPEAYVHYKRIEEAEGLVLGTINATPIYPKTVDSRGKISIDKWVVNALTQQTYGRDKNVQYASYGAIRSCMKEINKSFSGFTKHIAMPKIGCGLGNLEWDKVRAIIEEELVDIEKVSVYYL